MADRDDRGAASLRLVDHRHDHGAILGIQRGGGFIGNHPVLLLDEPTASLDAENCAAVVAMINEAKTRGTAIIAICHDAEVRDTIGDRLFALTPLQDAA